MKRHTDEPSQPQAPEPVLAMESVSGIIEGNQRARAKVRQLAESTRATIGPLITRP
jgi:hypothetical protein